MKPNKPLAFRRAKGLNHATLKHFHIRHKYKKHTMPKRLNVDVYSSHRRKTNDFKSRSPGLRFILLLALPSHVDQWNLSNFIGDYSSGGCIRFALNSLFIPSLETFKVKYLFFLLKYFSVQTLYDQ